MLYSSLIWTIFHGYPIPVIESMSGGLMDDVIILSSSVILGGFLIGLIIAFMSAAVPAYNALNLKVVDALRAG